MPLKAHLKILPLLIALLVSGAAENMFAQERIPVHSFDHPVLLQIEEAYQRGEISVDEAMLQKFYTVYKPEQKKPRFSTVKGFILKCFTPVMMEYSREKKRLSASTIAEIEELIAPASSSDTQQFLSPSGNFLIHYETSGSNAVPSEDSNNSGIPDYVESTAFAADSSYRYQVEQLGFTDFRLDDPYEIFFANFGFYGTTNQSGNTTFIRIHNTFNGFPPNSHPEGHQTGALYVTVAHEIKHAIQYAANQWRGDAGSFDWSEMDATLMEEIVHTDVNDYYNYIKSGFDSFQPNSNSIFGNPQNPTPGAYWHITWMLYFAEQHGMDFWVDVWSYVEDDDFIPFLDPVAVVLEARNYTLEKEHLINHMWHMSGGEYSLPDFGFSDRHNYPNPNFRATFDDVPGQIGIQDSVSTIAAHYYKILPPENNTYFAAIELEFDEPVLGIGIIAEFTNGTTDQKTFFTQPNTTFSEIVTDWRWDILKNLRVAVVNISRNPDDPDVRYRIYAESRDTVAIEQDQIARQFELKANYPNPFNPATNIEFELYVPVFVVLEVYDVTGRKVQTITSENLPPGNHRYTFDASFLSSGVYIYRLRTPDRQDTRKMLLIK